MMNSVLKATFLLIILAVLPSFMKAQPTERNTVTHAGNENPGSRFNHVISGEVVFLPDNVPFEGLKISFSDVGETTVGSDGTYQMEVPRHWTGTATPYLCGAGGYAFNPPQIDYVDVRFDIPDQDYSGEATTSYIVSGRFYDKFTGEPLANTEIKFNLTGINPAEEMYVTTNEQGEYSFEKLPCWGDTLDPYLSGYYYFEPMERGYSELESDMQDQDYEVTYYEFPLPDGWETINTGSFAFIAIENTSDPDICGQPLEIGDLIGVFYTDDNGELKCGGYTRWQNETNGFISAQGDDNTTNEKDGFSGGEPYIWQVYSYNSEQTFPASVNVVSGNNVFYGLGLTKVGGINALYENALWINKGWSGISSFTMPDYFPSLITSVTGPISNELVIIQDLEKMYYPTAGINTLLLWKYHKGYKIKMSDDAVLPMNGCPEEDRMVELNTTWNLMPVLSECHVPVEDFFQPVLDQLILVKEIGGTGIYWPAMNIQSLHMLRPGSAYLVAVSENTSVTFTDCGSLKYDFHADSTKNLSPWDSPKLTGVSHTIAVQSEAMESFEAGDFIGAFSQEGICVGLAEITHKEENMSIAVFGDDPLTVEKDGMEFGEEIKFRVFDMDSGNTKPVDANFIAGYPNSDGMFADNGLSVISDFKDLTASIGEPGFQISITPNPATDRITIKPGPGIPVAVSISDLNGRRLIRSTFEGSVTVDVSHLPAGIYVVRAEGRNFVATRKLVLK